MIVIKLTIDKRKDYFISKLAVKLYFIISLSRSLLQWKGVIILKLT